MIASYIFYAAIILGAGIWWRKTRTKSKQSFLIPGIPKGTVVLHQYGPAPHVPSISPFVMKLETYLRVAKIPYINRFDRKPGPKGKIPWIQYNDDVIPDSQIVIEFLNKEFKVDLNKNLTDQQKAVGHTVRKTAEEWLYWVLLMFRLVFETQGTVYRQLGLPSLVIWYMRRAAKPRLYSQGIGRHTKQEVTSMMKDDLAAIDCILEDKKFLFGDTPADVTEFDCALFGQLCQLAWQMPDCGVEEIIQEEFPRLVSYCQRMKESFWPDWEQRLKTSRLPAPLTPSPSSSSPQPSSETTSSHTNSSSHLSSSSSSASSPSVLSANQPDDGAPVSHTHITFSENGGVHEPATDSTVTKLTLNKKSDRPNAHCHDVDFVKTNNGNDVIKYNDYNHTDNNRITQDASHQSLTRKRVIAEQETLIK